MCSEVLELNNPWIMAFNSFGFLIFLVFLNQLQSVFCSHFCSQTQEKEMEKQRTLYQQARLHDRGAAEMVLQMISASKGNVLWSINKSTHDIHIMCNAMHIYSVLCHYTYDMYIIYSFYFASLYTIYMSITTILGKISRLLFWLNSS